jgi:hypothetical protein
MTDVAAEAIAGVSAAQTDVDSGRAANRQSASRDFMKRNLEN